MAQTLVITILTTSDAVSPTAYMSLSDFEHGLLNFLLCCETFLFGIAQVFTLSGLQFRHLPPANKPGVARGSDAGVLRYIFSTFVPLDYFKGVWLALKFLVRLPLGRKRFDYTAGGAKRMGSEASQPLHGSLGNGNENFVRGGYAMVPRDEEQMPPPQYERGGV